MVMPGSLRLAATNWPRRRSSCHDCRSLSRRINIGHGFALRAAIRAPHSVACQPETRHAGAPHAHPPMNHPSIERRDFLKQLATSGVNAAAAGILPNSSRAQTAAAPAAKRKLRVGVIGCGNVAGSYVPNLAASRKLFDIVSFCDIIPQRAAAFAKRYQVSSSRILVETAAFLWFACLALGADVGRTSPNMEAGPNRQTFTRPSPFSGFPR